MYGFVGSMDAVAIVESSIMMKIPKEVLFPKYFPSETYHLILPIILDFDFLPLNKYLPIILLPLVSNSNIFKRTFD